MGWLSGKSGRPCGVRRLNAALFGEPSARSSPRQAGAGKSGVEPPQSKFIIGGFSE